MKAIQTGVTVLGWTMVLVIGGHYLFGFPRETTGEIVTHLWASFGVTVAAVCLFFRASDYFGRGGD